MSSRSRPPRLGQQDETRRAGGTTAFVDYEDTRPGHRPPPLPHPPRRHWVSLAATIGVVAAVIAVALTFAVRIGEHRAHEVPPHPSHQSMPLPVKPDSYLGVYQSKAPNSYAGVTSFTARTGVKPRLVVYYSGWFEPFKTTFATTAVRHGAIPLIQINPKSINLAAIASGHYDSYLTSYAEAVRSYHHPVILGFGHEMNGNWYSWGYRHTSPAAFVAAWRHIVTVFRDRGARNVTWLWTVNVVHTGGTIASPAPWWPGNKYVTWVGLDGYYYKPSWEFAPLFGPTIVAIRQFTHAPMLIAETSAAPTTNQPAKIANLFAGVRLYGLLGFVWFNSVHNVDWRLNNPAAIAAFRRGAKTYPRQH
jgi:mannan endo-1,4-beta-mannosidase